MQFGKTLVGAVIGAVLGIGLLIAVYLAAGIDKMWMAIPVAILTGLGVRMMAAKSGDASYLRGAITVVLALAAYLGGVAITKSVATNRADKVAKLAPPPAAAKVETTDEKKKGEEPVADAMPAQAVQTPISTSNRGGHSAIAPNQNWALDFLWLAVAALAAYELGRGSGAAKAVVDDGPSEPATMGTHPDA